MLLHKKSSILSGIIDCRTQKVRYGPEDCHKKLHGERHGIVNQKDNSNTVDLQARELILNKLKNQFQSI